MGNHGENGSDGSTVSQTFHRLLLVLFILTVDALSCIQSKLPTQRADSKNFRLNIRKSKKEREKTLNFCIIQLTVSCFSFISYKIS